VEDPPPSGTRLVDVPQIRAARLGDS
jgi:hypothetical protein